MNDRVYILINPELGWDNVVSIALTIIGAVKQYTDDEIIPDSEEEAKKWIKENNLIIDDKKLRME